MPDHRCHRGMHPEDPRLFAPDQWPALRLAVAELSWLLGRGYAEPSSLKLVGDRHSLDARQRMAVRRCACTDDALARRVARQIILAEACGRELHIDGYNVLTTVEAALSGSVILLARDGCFRDIASIHGSYRKVEETGPAIDLVARTLASLQSGPCTWYLDAPVSNSGRLKVLLMAHAAARTCNWNVEIVPDPDKILCRLAETVCSADSVILDAPVKWLNLAREVVTRLVPSAQIVDLSVS